MSSGKYKTDYDMAKVSRDIVVFLLQRDDEGALSFAGFHIQQAVKMSLKYVLEQLAVDYKHTHYINSLVQELPADQLYFSQDLLSEIRNLSSELVTWETTLRYDGDYIVAKYRLEELLPLINKIIDAIARREEEDSKQFSKISGNLKKMHFT